MLNALIDKVLESDISQLLIKETGAGDIYTFVCKG